MAVTRDFKHTFAFIFFILAGIVLGGFISSICDGKAYVDWLAWGQSIGFDSVTVDLSVLTFTIGMKLKVTVAQIFCVAIMLIVNSKVNGRG